MAADQGNIWAKLRANIGEYGRLTRIESPMLSGIPDVHFVIRYGDRTAQGWIELKYAAKLPVRPKTPLRIVSLTEAQVNFAEEQERYGGKVFLLLKAADYYFLFRTAQMRRIYEAPLTFRDMSLYAAVDALGKFPTERILACLIT